MRATRPVLGTLALVALGAACSSEPEVEPAAERPIAARQAAAGQAGLPPELLSRLRAEYPVLGTERAPEPMPSPDANPEQIPERLRGALPPRVLETATGEATLYADKFEGRRTASGIPFRQNQMVAAHRGFPFGTLLRVTNLRNDRSVNVRVVDRGPFGSAANKRKTILDLSRRAATELGYVSAGRAQVRVEVLEWGDGLPQAT